PGGGPAGAANAPGTTTTPTGAASAPGTTTAPTGTASAPGAATAPVTPAAAGGREAHRGSGGGTSGGAAAAAQAAAERRPVVFRAGDRGAVPRLEHPDCALHQPQSRRGLLARHHPREPDAAAAGVLVAQALDLAQPPRPDPRIVSLSPCAPDGGTRVRPGSPTFPP